ncbi:hypothetical protein QE152_g36509 [Popillia japonica]|uniref:SWIM-type domain-containing protein n=1 Tax=Popillia japonica TaxID=7064 RepID=A0AAW1IDN9_POPJA
MKLFAKYTKAYQDGNTWFILATVAAEQRKNAEYKVSLVLENKLIYQANYTCPAGFGWSPACKHIAAICYSLEYFSITDSPQTWHVPRGSALPRHALENNPDEGKYVQQKQSENNLAEDENVQEKLSASLDSIGKAKSFWG